MIFVFDPTGQRRERLLSGGNFPREVAWVWSPTATRTGAFADWRLAIGDCGDPLDAGRCVGLLGGEFYRATGRGGEGFLPAEATEAGAQPPRRTGSGQAAKPNDEPSTHEPNSTDVEHDHVKSFTALPGGVEYEEELRS